MTRRWWRGLAALALLLALLLTLWASLAAGLWPERDPHIVRGVRVLTTDLGGLTVAEARAALADTPLTTRTVSLHLDAETATATAGDLGLAIVADATVERALRVGRLGGLFDRLRERRIAARTGSVVAPILQFDAARAAAFLAALAEKTNLEVADAVLELGEQGEFVRREAVIGRRLDEPAAFAALLAWATRGRTDDDPPPLPVTVTPPARTLDAYAGIEAEIARFHTEIGGARDRVANVTLAAATLNGLLIRPGDEFSFNRVIGPRTKDRGYKEAPIIYAGKLVPGIGGGICQTSSTLFNAAAAAGLTLLERHNHSHPVPYVLPGRDGAVSFGTLDLRFRNDLAVPLAILTRVERLTLHIVIAGPSGLASARLVTTTPRVKAPPVKEIPDPKLPAGRRVVVEEGEPSIFVITSRVWGAGETERIEELTRSYYPAKPRVVRVGTGSATPVPAGDPSHDPPR